MAALLVGGLAVKVPVWPLHTWLPSAHTAAPTVGSVLLAGVLLKMGSYGMVRIAVPTVPQGFSVVAPYLGALGVVGILWGGLVCLVERDLKRLVAYSSVAHMGFVALGHRQRDAAGVAGRAVRERGARRDHRAAVPGGRRAQGALRQRDCWTASAADCGTAARAWVGCWPSAASPGSVCRGWPGSGASCSPSTARGRARPTAGDLGFWRTLAVLAVVGTVLAAAYLLRVLRQVWHGVPATPPLPTTSEQIVAVPAIHSDATRVEVWVGTSMVAVTLVLGLVPWLLLRLTEPAVQALLAIARGGV